MALAYARIAPHGMGDELVCFRIALIPTNQIRVISQNPAKRLIEYFLFAP